MDFSSYRLSSYLTSIICSSIISTTVICTILSSSCFTTSSSPSLSTTSGSRPIYGAASHSLSSQYSQRQYHSTSSRHNQYHLNQQQKRQKQHGSLDCISHERPWTYSTLASSCDTAPYVNSGSRGRRNSKRQSISYAPLSPIYGGDGEDELRAIEQVYDVQRALFLKREHGRQMQHRSRVMNFRSKSQRWIVDNLFGSSGSSFSRDNIYGDAWEDEDEDEDDNEDEEDDVLDEYEHEDNNYREVLDQYNDHPELAPEKNKERHTLDAILLPRARNCPWIPQWTWLAWKQQYTDSSDLQYPQQQQGKYVHHRRHVRLCRRRLYPKHSLNSQPHQHQPQQNPLSRQPISHKQLPWIRKSRTWRLDSMQHDPQRLHYQPYNQHHAKKHYNLHTTSRHPGRRRSRNGRRTTSYSSSKSFSSVCTTFFNNILSSLFSSPPPPRRQHLNTGSKGKSKKNNGAMDTLLYFLSDLPSGLSSLLHQEFASALFSTPPTSSSSSTRSTPQHQQQNGSWLSNNYYLGGINNVHGPQRIPPHPLLEMAASNMLIRLVLLIILCLGAFYYCVTTMEQQQRQIAGADGGVGSNWLADPVSSSASTATTSATNSATAASRRNNAPTTATENRSRRLMSGLNSTTTTTSTGSITSLGGSAAGTITGGTVPLLTPNMTAAEVMASLGRSVNNLEQFHHQQLQQLRQQRTVRGSLLNLTSINGTGNEGPNSADSTATTPLTAPSSLTATIISALIRSTATAMALTCGSNQLQSHLTPYSASTTPATLCTDVFSGVATGDKAGFEPEWNQDAEGLPLKKKKDISQDQGDTSSLPTYNKDKQKDLNSFDEDSVYQSEQEFGRFSPTGPTNTSDLAGDEDSWREYRNMMYYSTNYPPPYSTGGGGESSRSNSRRSSVFTPPPSKSISTAATTHTTAERSGERRDCSELAEEKEMMEPLWMHFYSLDALQSTICQRLFIASQAQQHLRQKGRQSHNYHCSRPTLLRKQPRGTNRKVPRQNRRITFSREVSTSRSLHSILSLSSSSSTSVSLADTTSLPSSTLMSVSAASEPSILTLGVSSTSRRSRVRMARRQRLSQ